MRWLGLICIALLFGLGLPGAAWTENQKGKENMADALEIATFAGGCFWCLQPAFDNLAGVVKTEVGYTGGDKENPTYEEVSSGKTGHLEAIQVTFDTTKIEYKALVEEFLRNIDPTDPGGQFADRGSQYHTAVFYHSEKQRLTAEESKTELERSGKFKKPVATLILPAKTFYPAEEYHQEYHQKNPAHYKSYKIGSGRAGFIEENWGKKH